MTPPPPGPNANSRKPYGRPSKTEGDQIVAIFVKLVEGKIDVGRYTEWIRTGDIRALIKRNPELCVEEVTRVKFAKFFLLVIKFLLDKRIVESKWKKPDYNNPRKTTAIAVPAESQAGFEVTSETYEANFPSIGQVGHQSKKKKQLLNRFSHHSECSNDNKSGANRTTGRRAKPTKISLDVDPTKTWPPGSKNDSSGWQSFDHSLQPLVEPQNASVEVLVGLKPTIKITRHTTKAFDSLVKVYNEILNVELCPSVTSEIQHFMNILLEKPTPFSTARKHISKQNIAVILGLRIFMHKEDCLTFALKVLSSKLDVLMYSYVSINSLIDIIPDDFPEFKQPFYESTQQCIDLMECNNLLSLVNMFQSLNFALEQHNCTNNNILVINEFESMVSEWHHKLAFTQDEIIEKLNLLLVITNQEVGNLTLLAEKFVGRLIHQTINQSEDNLLNFHMPQTHDEINCEFNYEETFFKEFLTYCFTMSPTLVMFIKQTLIFSIKKITAEIQELNIATHPFPKTGCGCVIEYIKILKCLGKFLGFIEFRPFWTLDAASEDLIDRYIIFRSETPPPLDFVTLFKEACKNGTLGVIIPLIVEFISMGDVLSLRLPYVSGINSMLLSIKSAVPDPDGARTIRFTFDEPKETLFVKVSSDTFNFLSMQMGKIFTISGFHEEYFYNLMESVFHLKGGARKLIVDNSIRVSRALILETCFMFNAINCDPPALHRTYARHPTVIPNENSETCDNIQLVKEKLSASFLSGYKGMNTIIDFLLTRALQVCEKEFPIIYIQLLNEPITLNGEIIPSEKITLEDPITVKLVEDKALKLKSLMTEKAEEIKKRNLEAFPLLLDLNLPEPVVATAEKLLTEKLDISIKTLMEQKYPEENMVSILINEYLERKPKPERDEAEIAPMLIRLQSSMYAITIRHDLSEFNEDQTILLFNQIMNEALETADRDNIMNNLIVHSMDLIWTIVVTSPEKITLKFITDMTVVWKALQSYTKSPCDLRFLCARNIQMALESKVQTKIPTAVTLIFQQIIDKKCITFREFEEQSLSIFHTSWDKDKLKFINQLLDDIRDGLKNMRGPEGGLLLDWMVDASRELQDDFD